MKSHGKLYFAAASMMLCMSAGCSSKTDDIQKDLQALQSEVARLRSANLAMQDRLDGMDMQRSKPAAAAEEGDDPSDRPVLEVVRLAPEGTSGDQEVIVTTPMEEGPRPIIGGDDGGVAQYSDEGEARKALEQSRKDKDRKAKMDRWKRGNQ